MIRLATSLFLLAIAGLAFADTKATPAPSPYAAMAPLAQYLVANRDDEIAMARSSAPPAISNDAEVLVLGPHGYETAAKGKNGFVCIVERSWADAFDDPEFYSPKVRSPNCFNAPAARTVLPQYLKRTEWVLAGVSLAEMRTRTKQLLADKTFVASEPGAMCYMMSSRGHLNDRDDHWMPHLMIYVPHAKAPLWGAGLPGSPVIALEGDDYDPDTLFLIPLHQWSDGTPAPTHHGG